MENNAHLGHRARLREQVRQNGLNSLNDHQAIEYILTFVIPQKDTNPLAHELINTFGSFSGVLQADYSALIKVKGVGEVVATFLCGLRDVFYYYQQNLTKQIKYIHNTMEAKEYAKSVAGNKLVEEAYCVCLDPTCKVVNCTLLGKGVSNQIAINIRTITDVVVKQNVHNIIIFHNHPLGNMTPSAEDDKFTKALTIAMAINGVNLLDHVVVGTDDCYSYRTDNKIDEYSKEVNHLLSNGVVAQNKAPYEVV